MPKSKASSARSDPDRVVHVNLRSLHLPPLYGEQVSGPLFKFSSAARAELVTCLPHKAIDDLEYACHDLTRRPLFTGKDARSNHHSAVLAQLTAVEDLADALQTVLLHMRGGIAGELLARSREEGDAALHEFELHLLALRRRALESAAPLRYGSASGGRPRAPVSIGIRWIAAVLAAHRITLGRGADTRFTKVCEPVWRVLGHKASPRHALVRFFADLDAGRVNFLAPAPRRGRWQRGYWFRSDECAQGYAVSIIPNMLAHAAEEETAVARRKRA